LLSIVQLMVDGQVGLNPEVVLSLVELEVKNMSDLVPVPNQPMVVKHVQAQLQNQKTVTHMLVHIQSSLAIVLATGNIWMYGAMQCIFGKLIEQSLPQVPSNNGNFMADAVEQFIFRYLEDLVVADTNLLDKQRLQQKVAQIQLLQILLSEKEITSAFTSLVFQSYHLMDMNVPIKDHTMSNVHLLE